MSIHIKHSKNEEFEKYRKELESMSEGQLKAEWDRVMNVLMKLKENKDKRNNDNAKRNTRRTTSSGCRFI